jgi:hypothetical protein
MRRAFPLLVFVTAYDQYALQAFEAAGGRLPGQAGAGAPGWRPVCDGCVSGWSARHGDAPAGRAGAGGELDDRRWHAAARAAGAVAPARRGRPGWRSSRPRSAPWCTWCRWTRCIYFEAADKYVRVVTAEREHLIRMSLRELLPQLDPQRFWQVHRGTVVQAAA